MPAQAMRSGTVSGSLRVALDHAWDAREFAAAEVMSSTGLTRSTAIEALDRLTALGLLRELPNARAAGQYRKGRPSRRFELRSDAAVVVGVDAGRGHLTAVVADLRGATMSRLSVATDETRDEPQARRRAIDQTVAGALTESGASRSDVLAICVGVPAAVDSRGVSPRHSEGFWQRMNPGLQEMFAEWVPIVRVENDAALAAVAEGAVGAAAGSRDFVAVLAGDRLGIGAVLGGTLLRGAHGAAGEPVGLRWVSGVETDSGLGVQMAWWAGADVEPDTSGHLPARVDPAGVTARTVLDRAAAGDAWAADLVDRAGAVLGRIGLVLASLYDPERIVICGALAQPLERAVALADAVVADHLHGPAPAVVPSPLGADVVVTGAVMGAVEAAREGALELAVRRAAELDAATASPASGTPEKRPRAASSTA